VPVDSRLEHYGELIEFGPYKAVIRVPRERIKQVAAQLLASDFPVDDILISEVAVDEVVREIFQARSGKG
jgi:ABC-type uncharacterized transport system ATPase subunit